MTTARAVFFEQEAATAADGAATMEGHPRQDRLTRSTHLWDGNRAMREYGKIKASFWENQKIGRLDDQGKLLAVYLITCRHSNSIGCFSIPFGYIAEDLGWSRERVEELIDQLVLVGFVEYDKRTKIVRIRSWFQHNTFENRNVAMAAKKLALSLEPCDVSRNCIKGLIEFDNKFINEWRTELMNALKNGIGTPEPDPEHEPKPKPEPQPTRARASPASESAGGGSGGGASGYSDQARAVTAAFLAARSRLWPNESALAAPTLTILAQAEGYVARAGSAQLVVEIVNRQIERAAAIGKRAPSSLAAYNRSLDDGITSHLAATKPVDKPRPSADDSDPPAWERPGRLEEPANGAATNAASDLVNGKPYPTDDFIRASDPGAAPFWIAVRDWRTHRKWRNASGNDITDREPIPEEWLPPVESAKVHNGPGYGQIEAWWVSKDWARH